MSLIAQSFENGGLVRETYQEAVDPGSITTGAQVTVDVTLTGVTSSDEVLSCMCKTVLEAGIHFKGAVCATDKVTMTFENTTGGTINPGSETWNIQLLRTTAKQA